MADARLSSRKTWVCVLALLLVLTAFLCPSWVTEVPFKSPHREYRLPIVSEKLPLWDSSDCSGIRQASPTSENDEVGGTCGRRAWASGNGQQVVALSLYGNKAAYWLGMDTLLTQVRQHYPGWKVRLYTDARWRKSVLCPLLRDHAHFYVCDVENLPPPLGNVSAVHPMLWRALPLGDLQVAAMIVRDTDSPISSREAAAVEQWLASNKTFHIMRDHPAHDTPILGGMWGARWDNLPAPRAADELARVRDKMLKQGLGKSRHGVDQEILTATLWPVAQGRMIGHDSYLCKKYAYSAPWPTQRQDGFFVGAPRFRAEYSQSSLSQPCPEACRPPRHRDWLYC
ncbi:uncharacterized protein LOC122255530 [Penaeus japonicus]|uniref:uncharacterized protein LOC122255530 n=1 Tax=Penaeus japonicus TaxID=27405 RepID=UPI001C70D655|nr:uncharacterized protein LOC122255530 [Penaeus japonicus]XP_042875614.1 uncharacterized protein LOC122255530 [Penaeus japonicus]